MARKPEPSFEVKKLVWEAASTAGKSNIEAIWRQLDYELERRRKECIIFEDTPDPRTVRRIIEKDINDLRPEVVRAKLPPYVWHLRTDYETLKKATNIEPTEEVPQEEQAKQNQYKETRHEQRMRGLAIRLGDEMGIPYIFESFIADLKPGRVQYLAGLTVIASDKAKIRVGLPIEADTAIIHLYQGLVSHLKTGGFSAVLDEISIWRRQAEEDLKTCHRLGTLVQEEVQQIYNIKIAANYQGQHGITIYFPITLCAAAVEQARGRNYIDKEWYKTEAHDLRFGAFLIYRGMPDEDLNSYEAKHIQLRESYANLELTKRIAKQRESLHRTIGKIRLQLQKFKDMERLPGQCELCSHSS